MTVHEKRTPQTDPYFIKTTFLPEGRESQGRPRRRSAEEPSSDKSKQVTAAMDTSMAKNRRWKKKMQTIAQWWFPLRIQSIEQRYDTHAVVRSDDAASIIQFADCERPRELDALG